MKQQYINRRINTATFNYQASKQAYRINHARKRETLPAVPEQEQAHKLMLIVMGQPIRNKGELFSANDLWRIAGGNTGKNPGEWLKNNRTQEIINSISGRGISLQHIYETHQRGVNQGVWLCEDLMYAYASWMNPEFHLFVIQCFKEYARAQITRMELRGESKALNNALMITRQEIGKDTRFYHYSNEYRMINRVLLGMPMEQYMKRHDIPKNKLRDYLTPEQLKRLDRLINHDSNLIELDYSYAEREAELIRLNDRLLARERQALPSKSE